MHTIIAWICVCTCWSRMAMADEEASSGTSPRCPPAALPTPRCLQRNHAGSATNEFEYLVEDQKIIISYEDGRYLEVVCNGWAALDSAALPAFPSERRVPRVTLSACPPPAGATPRPLALVLRRLNVTLLRSAAAPAPNLTLASLPPRPPLQRAHFAGLEDLVELKLIARTADWNAPDRPAPLPGFLGPLRSLRSLLMMGVRLPPGELDRPPASLRSLNLHSSGIRRPPTAVLALSNLRRLVMSEDDLAEFHTVPPTLRMLSLESKNTTTIRLKSIPKLETVTLTKWSETRPEALVRCDELVALQLLSPAVEVLPAGWVGRCPRIDSLVVTNAAALTSLPATLLQAATALRHLSLKQGVLEALPVGLLDDVPNLRTLDLTGNRLQMLPSGMFASPRELQTLSLSHNLLPAESVALLAGLLSLTELNLAFNPRLGDLCERSPEYSRLFQLKKLTSLSLYKTSITHICRDWRDSLTSLKTLNLGQTNISELWYSDLRYTRDEAIADAAVVRLEGAPIVSVRFSEEEYVEAGGAGGARSGALVQLDGEPRLHCDCYVYWARLALALPASRGARVAGLRCASGRALQDVPPDELHCAAPDLCRTAALPPSCTCAARPAPLRRLLLTVRCDAAALTSLPSLPSANDTIYDLLLPNNNISAVVVQDLPPHLRVLDLRNNSLERLEESVAWDVVGSGRMLLLSGNPLACDCRLAPLLQALHAAGNASDLRFASCADGSPLREAATHRCARVPLAAWLTATLAALLAVVALVVAYFASPARRVLIKAMCYRWGLLRLPPEPPAPEGGFRFDAFVCFSHKDEDVVQQFMKRLESGSDPYRLCLHCRDWVPGLLISEQIGESMRLSRRTVVLVSNAFFESDWTQAEFREAYALALRDITPRLIVVLLDDPEKLPLDDGLQRYISTNTYVRWGDLRFWDKLQLALGSPLPSPPATATSPSIILSSITTPATPAMSPTFVTSPASSTPLPVYPVNSSSSTSPLTLPSTEQILLNDHVSDLDDTDETSSVSSSLEPALIPPTDPLAARCLAAREQELLFPPTPAPLPSCTVAVAV